MHTDWPLLACMLYGKNIIIYNHVCFLSMLFDADMSCTPESLEHGTVEAVADHLEVFDCESDYVLVGDIIRMCLKNGRWSGSKPSCQCKRHHLILHSVISLTILVRAF